MEKEFNGITCRFKSDPELSNVIYEMEFSNGKKYIGQTIQPLGVRMRQHCADASTEGRQWNILKSRAIRKHKRFDVRVIEHCKTVDGLNKREDEIIEEYKSKGQELYNVASGGLNNCEYFGIECVVTDKEFNALKEFDRVKDAKKYAGGCHTSVNGRYYLIRGKYYVMHKDEYRRHTKAEHKERALRHKGKLREQRESKKKDKALQLAKIKYNGDLLGFIDAGEVRSQYGSSITHVAYGRGKTRYACGCYWLTREEYEKRFNNGSLHEVLQGLERILQVDRRGRVMGDFQTIREASEKTGVNAKTISKTLNYKTVTSTEHFFIRYTDWRKVERDKDYPIGRTTHEIRTGEAKEVSEYDENMKLLRTYSSIKECAAAIGVDHSDMSLKLKRREAMIRNRVYRLHCKQKVSI